MGARDSLHGYEGRRTNGGRHPNCEIDEDVIGRIGQPKCLRASRGDGEESCCGKRRRPVTAELGGSGHLPADTANVSESLV